MLYVLADSNAKRQLGNRPYKTIIAKDKINFNGKDIIFFSINSDINELNVFGTSNNDKTNIVEMQIGGRH